jgi:hypothetical protein
MHDPFPPNRTWLSAQQSDRRRRKRQPRFELLENRRLLSDGTVAVVRLEDIVRHLRPIEVRMAAPGHGEHDAGLLSEVLGGSVSAGKKKPKPKSEGSLPVPGSGD